MTSRRPYREPLTIEQARAELQRCTGQQYDPQVVQAFVRVLDERARELVIVESKADVLGQIPQQMNLNRVT